MEHIMTVDWKRRAENLRRRRTAGKRSLSLVAKELGVHRNTLHRYESGKRQPTMTMYLEWVGVLHRLGCKEVHDVE